jgi:ribosomal-protein-serine acetyltransferase
VIFWVPPIWYWGSGIRATSTMLTTQNTSAATHNAMKNKPKITLGDVRACGPVDSHSSWARMIGHSSLMIDNRTRLPGAVASARVQLRRWVAADAPVLGEVVTRNVDHLRPWMPWIAQEPVSDADRVALFEGWERAYRDGGEVVYGVFLDGQPIGGTGLHKRRGPTGLEIGYWIDKDHTNHGIATEVARTLTTAALTVPGITFVEIHHDKANLASRRVPEKLGYTFVGETQDSVTSPGEVGIDCGWRMDAVDWIAD